VYRFGLDHDVKKNVLFLLLLQYFKSTKQMVAKYSKFLFVVFLLITLIDIVIVVVAGCLKKL